jgi:hypothetical protein
VTFSQPGPRPGPPSGGFRPGPQPGPSSGGLRQGPSSGGLRPTPAPGGPRPAAEPAPAGLGLPSGADGVVTETGHPAVDAVLRSLANAARLAPAEQVAEYEAAHQVLQETLASIDG